MMVRTYNGAPSKRDDNDRASAVTANNDRDSAVGGEHPHLGLGRMSKVMTAASGVGPVAAKERESR